MKLAEIVQSCKRDKIGRVSWFNHFIGRFSGQLNNANESWPTSSIVWHVL